MRNPGIILSIAIAGAFLAVAPVFGQNKPAATNAPKAAAAPAVAQNKPAATNAPAAVTAPEQSSLVVGALQIGSVPNLVIHGVDISVASNSIAYSYYFENTGSTELGLTASVSLPSLEASADGSETWVLGSNDPENPIGLSITAAGAPVTTKAEVHAYALDLDRLAEIKAERLPLIPFGPALDKALAALSPEAAARLAALGLISLPNPAQPKAVPIADWTLEVVHSWRQVLPPRKTTPIVVKFTPVVAQYKLGKGDEQDIADMKDDVCIKPPVLNALRSRLWGGGSWKVTDISIDNEAPAHWIDSPNPTLSVQKPTANAIVAFCGMDDKTASKPAVLGVAPDDDDEIRIVIFEPAAK